MRKQIAQMKHLLLREAEPLASDAFNRYLLDHNIEVSEDVAKRLGRSAVIAGDFWNFHMHLFDTESLVLHTGESLPPADDHLEGGRMPQLLAIILVDRTTGTTEIRVLTNLSIWTATAHDQKS